MLTTVLRNNRYALIASALVLPAIAFELIGMSKFALPENPVYAWFDANLGYPQVNPVARTLEYVVVIGPVLALLLTLIPTVRFELRREQSSLISTLTIKGDSWNIAIIAVSAIVLAILGTYIILENWQCIIGVRASC